MKNISDEKLLAMCKMYGKQAIIARRKFLGLLPEVNRRRLFEKRGFNSIFEFAFKMAGVSEEQVRDVLNLEKRFVDKPNLHKALVSGSVSANKLVRVAALATTANEKVLVELAQSLPQKALELFVREERAAGSLLTQGRHIVGAVAEKAESNGLQTSIINSESVRTQSFLRVELSDEVQEKLNELQEKGLDVNIHHTARFAIAHNHNPQFLAPLCKEHHVLAHTIDRVFGRHFSGKFR